MCEKLGAKLHVDREVLFDVRVAERSNCSGSHRKVPAKMFFVLSKKLAQKANT